MSVPTIPALTNDKTKEEVFDDLVQAAVDEKLSTSAWQPGEPIRAVMSVVARVVAALWLLVIGPALRGAFLDYATGTWLTLLAWTSYGTLRKGKEFARATLVLENRSLVFVAISIGQIRLKCTSTGKTFTNITGGSVGAWSGSGAYPTVPLVFQADEAGTASDVPSGEIDALPVTAPLGIFAQTNAAAILGSDEELDEDLRARCRLAMAPLSPAGPRAAYEYVALSATRPDGNPVSVTRVRVIALFTGAAYTFVADRNGPTPASDVTIVYSNILRYVAPVGITPVVTPAAPRAGTLSLHVYVDARKALVSQEVSSTVKEAVEKYMSLVPIGGYRTTDIVSFEEDGYVFGSEVASVASRSTGGIVKVDVAWGGGAPDFVLGYYEIPIVSVSVTVELVTQS